MSSTVIQACVDQILRTEEERIKAVEAAIEENPANLLIDGQTFPPGEPPPPAELALIINKKGIQA